jgi:hypothetical protein
MVNVFCNLTARWCSRNSPFYECFSRALGRADGLIAISANIGSATGTRSKGPRGTPARRAVNTAVGGDSLSSQLQGRML